VPISDSYIVQYLVDGTSQVPAGIHWREKDAEQIGYVARLEDVEVVLEPFYSRSGSRLGLRFRHGGDEFSLQEPARAAAGSGAGFRAPIIASCPGCSANSCA